MMPLFYQRYYPKERPFAIVVSQHKDGEILAKIAQKVGIRCLRGSSKKGAVGVLKESMRAITEGVDVALTPDGPRGPRHSIAEGVTALSSRKKVPIVTLNARASRVWRLSSWDKMFIPKPFSTIEFFIGEPFETTALSPEIAKEELKARLMRHAF